MTKSLHGSQHGGSRLHARDVVALCALVVLAIALIAWQLVVRERDGSYAVVHDGDGGVTRLSLAEDSQTTIQTSLGSNVVVVEDGAVHVGDADCPNLDCVRQGAISSPGQQIICLPHRLWIEVVDSASDESSSMDVDAVPTSDIDAYTR